MSEVNNQPLFLEVGNSAWKAARFNPTAQALEACGRGNTQDHLYQWLQQQPEQQLVLATVGAEQEMVDLLAKLKQQGYQALRAQTTEIAGFEHCYTEPSCLGVDRWLTLLALRESKLPVVVIDAGTAITLDLMDVGGKHLGGWIAPGLQLMQEALVNRSSRLKASEQVPMGRIGVTTESAIGLGCKAALQGFCEQAVVVANEQFAGRTFNLYLSGGGARYINSSTLPNCQLRPLLVLEGLYAWWQEQL